MRGGAWWCRSVQGMHGILCPGNRGTTSPSQERRSARLTHELTHWGQTMKLRRFWPVLGLVVAAAGTVGTWYGVVRDGPQLAQADQRVVGASIVSNGGTGADIYVNGVAGQPAPVGWDVQASGRASQSTTGLQVIQNGPGTGMRITVGGDGPATGVRVNVTGR